MRQVVSEFRLRAPDAVAVIDDSGQHTVRELWKHADALAGAASGTVLVQADNSWRTVAASLAVGASGGTLAVVNRHTTAAEFAAAIEDVQPDAVIAEPAALAEWAVEGLLPGGAATPVLDGWRAWSVPGRRDVSRWGGGCLIGLTSGSTGRAKGVVQSEDALRYAAAAQTIAINGLRPGDAVAAIVPSSRRWRHRPCHWSPTSRLARLRATADARSMPSGTSLIETATWRAACRLRSRMAWSWPSTRSWPPRRAPIGGYGAAPQWRRFSPPTPNPTPRDRRTAEPSSRLPAPAGTTSGSPSTTPAKPSSASGPAPVSPR